ncbi:MAG: hypothetical protein AAF604_18245 [Acidobacteriota bacterium]
MGRSARIFRIVVWSGILSVLLLAVVGATINGSQEEAGAWTKSPQNDCTAGLVCAEWDVMGEFVESDSGLICCVSPSVIENSHATVSECEWFRQHQH